MSTIRVLVADDSLVVRRVVREELSAQPDIEVVGEAANGRIALEKLETLIPDIVILDIEMPEMDGLTALTHIRHSHPRIPVVMFSSLTVEGAAATLEALARGAADFFAKPAGAGGLEASRRIIREHLVPSLRALSFRAAHQGLKSSGPARVPPITTSSLPTSAPLQPALPTPSNPPSKLLRAGSLPPAAAVVRPQIATPPARIEVLAIGASTGGPNALAELFAGLPRDMPVPIVVVQHMPPMFTQMLAERLSRQSLIPAVEARSGMLIEPGHAYIAPGDFHLTLTREGAGVVAKIDQSPQENACRPAFDPLLRSVASLYGRNSLSVVLTGMGQDGLRGCEAIRAASGQILVQDEATSVVWGMPGAVARAGLADQVLPLPRIADEIVSRVRSRRA